MGLTQQILEDQNKPDLDQMSQQDKADSNNGFEQQNIEYDAATQAQAENTERQTITESELREKAQNEVGKDRLKKLVSQYMPQDTYHKIEQGQLNMDQLVQEVNHISVRFLSNTDVANMDDVEREKFEQSIAKKIARYDAIKRWIFLDLYDVENAMMLRRSSKVENNLATNLREMEKELYGRVPAQDFADLHRKILDSLPDYIKQDKGFSGAVDYLSKGANATGKTGGVKAILRQLGEKERVLRDLDDMIGASIAEYQQTMSNIRDEISTLNQDLGKEPGNKALVQQRMEKNAMFNTYLAEKEKLEEAQDRVLDDMLDAHADYELLAADIDLKEATVHDTKEALRDLKAGIKVLESTRRSKGQAVRIGNHMMYVQQARELSKKVNVVGPMQRWGLVYLMKNMASAIRSNGGYRDIGREDVAQINLEAKQAKREQAELIKRDMDRNYTV
jgi:hypothetical protein